ncbi:MULTISPECIES: hemerythrin domain-containing protein [unclassified Sphingomonas]|uniref:hemerythrin domain-containing protein n=1 Tax=unclassified Sphingomonas TaxID=196159 RepID=UPI001AC49DD3|nr:MULTISPECIES: hemerythrin domain-containing protein [unclassified Sphingomonas]MBN8847236.1 hemerythrin domain-containing protein [Sphingomonas sp.]
MLAGPSRLDAAEPTLDTLEEDHAIQRALCRDIEALADGLPKLPPLPEVRRLCDRVMRVAGAHLVRAELVFERLPAGQGPSDAELETLREMHALDATHADDLVMALWDHVGREPEAHVGQLSYMLRCFFDGCRRAIALKESWIAAARRAGAGPGLRPD